MMLRTGQKAATVNANVSFTSEVSIILPSRASRDDGTLSLLELDLFERLCLKRECRTGFPVDWIYSTANSSVAIKWGGFRFTMVAQERPVKCRPVTRREDAHSGQHNPRQHDLSGIQYPEKDCCHLSPLGSRASTIVSIRASPYVNSAIANRLSRISSRTGRISARWPQPLRFPSQRSRRSTTFTSDDRSAVRSLERTSHAESRFVRNIPFRCELQHQM